MKARDPFAAIGRAARRGGAAIAAAALIALALPTLSSADPAEIAIDPVTTVSITSATVEGELTPDTEAAETYWFVQYALQGTDHGGSGEENWQQAGFTSVPGGAAAPVAENLSGLVAGTSYEARLGAVAFEGASASENKFSSIETFSTDPAVAPTLVLDPPSAVTDTGAHLAGSVDPEGGNEDAVAGVLPIAWELQLNREGEGWNTVGSGEFTGAEAESDEPIDVEAAPTDLVPNSNYKVRLLVRYAGLEETSGEEEFDTPAVGPTIRRETLFNPTATSIELRSQVNPHNAVLTECHFEYGANGALDRTAPCESLPGGNGFAAVAAEVTDLAPGTEYGFRLVATNSVGTEEGALRTFTSLEEPAPENCPNEAIRRQQHATHLPDCRAWEMVTPLEKGNGDIVADGLTNIASTDGNAITFNSRTPFGDTIGSGVAGNTTYIARRGVDGWASHAITPTGNPEAPQVLFTPTRTYLFSDDLRNAVVQAYDLPAVPDDTPLRNNLYLENTASRELEPVSVSQVDQYPFLDFTQDRFWGLSADARHLAFVTRTQFLQEAPPGVPNVYRWDDGVLSLAGVLPDGTVPIGGSRAPIEPPAGGGYRQTMSADGTRLLFIASDGGSPQLYQRIDGERTIWISQTELDPSDPDYQPDASNVELSAATPDGGTVFFVTDTPLVDGDTNDGADLYRYTDSSDPSNDVNLTRISESGGFGGEVIGTSDDGQRIYFHVGGGNAILMWDHGVTRAIASGVIVKSAFQLQLAATTSMPGLGRVSSDGRYVAFAFAASTLIDPLGNVTNRFRQLYLYSLDNDTLLCISCPAEEAAGEIALESEVTDGATRVLNVGIRPNFLSDRGQVFFSTSEKLADEDINGASDAYLYDPTNGLSLLSSGKAGVKSGFSAASPSGNDVFIATREALLGMDQDELVDLYDVRVEGGLPEPRTPPSEICSGETCQGKGTAAPLMQGFGSAIGSRGNIPNRRCPKSKKRVRRHGKVRCVSKKSNKTRTHRVHAGRGGGR